MWSTDIFLCASCGGVESYLSHFWLYLQYILFLSGILILLVLIHRTIFIFLHYKSNQKKDKLPLDVLNTGL